MLALRDYQQRTMEEAVRFLTTAGRRLYVSPCGTGKSYIEVGIQQSLPDSIILTPRQEIKDGMVEKGGDPNRIYTPITYRNRLLEGTVRRPASLIIDEAHHDTAETGETIRLCIGDTPTVAFTATPFRGTPSGTAALRALYGEPHYVLRLAEAVARGLCVIPKCNTEPILDDDIVEISGGEFQVRAVEGKTDWEQAADLVQCVWKSPKPTVVAVSSVRATTVLGEGLARRGIPYCIVTGDSPRYARAFAFGECAAARSVLIQINVVSEGVDLHVRTLIDLAPTVSPVKWMQQIGRAMRPGAESTYICCNRNLLRHGYLFEGLLPPEAFVGAQLSFPKPPKRGYARAFGLEGVGRLKPCVVPLANGLQATAYYVTRSEGHLSAQYAAIVLPHSPQVLWATRENLFSPSARPDRRVDVAYGDWVRCDPPTDLKGFATITNNPVSPKQEAWWRRAAARHGLDADADLDARTFAVLPVLYNTRSVINI